MTKKRNTLRTIRLRDRKLQTISIDHTTRIIKDRDGNNYTAKEALELIHSGLRDASAEVIIELANYVDTI